MPLSSPAYTDDAIWAQNTSMYVVGAPNEIGGLQSLDLQLSVPKEINADTMGKSRYRRTGPMQVQWTARRWMLYKASLIDALGSSVVVNHDSYGNYNWDQLIFDISDFYATVTPTGVSLQSGGWNLRYCTVTRWGVGHSDPFAFWTEDIEGMAFGMYQTSWS